MNRNSALIWLPKVLELRFPTPKTEIVYYHHNDFVAVLEGEVGPEALGSLVEEVRSACKRIGYPCFIRTDLASAKHEGPSSYLVEKNSDIKRVLGRTVQDNEIKFWPTREPPVAFLIREFLLLDAPFKAFYGLPIAREWRFFASGKSLICAHPYWPKGALEFHGCPPPKDWEKQLEELHEKPFHFEQLGDLAIRLAKELNGEWSVDFAKDRFGTWWLIDCAVAQDSWHWPDCPNAKGA